MLEQVKFKSFKSFSKETIISCIPTKSEILSESNTYNDILKGCAFYGSNASGKTNALTSITLLLDLLFTDVPLFGLHSFFNDDEYLSFEYKFNINNNIIVYSFSIKRDGTIFKEKLTSNENIYLNRIGLSAESNITENKLYDHNDITDKTLFLKNIYFNTKFAGYKDLIDWYNYLKNSIYLNPARQANGQIVNFDKTQNDIFLMDYLDKNGTEEINNFLIEFNFPYTIKYTKSTNPIDKLISFSQRLYLIRKNMKPIPYLLESYGNQVLLKLLPSILKVCKTGGMLAIDEFSSGLHNKLEELLIKYIFNHSTNVQLFFVSHSTNLLKTSLLRPDQIYSVDFDEYGSLLYKFSEEHPRESQNLEKMYLSGVFRGIPLYNENKN